MTEKKMLFRYHMLRLSSSSQCIPDYTISVIINDPISHIHPYFLHKLFSISFNPLHPGKQIHLPFLPASLLPGNYIPPYILP